MGSLAGAGAVRRGKGASTPHELSGSRRFEGREEILQHLLGEAIGSWIFRSHQADRVVLPQHEPDALDRCRLFGEAARTPDTEDALSGRPCRP